MEKIANAVPDKNNTIISLICAGVATGLFAAGFYSDPFLLIVFALFVPMCLVVSFARCSILIASLSTLLFGVMVWLMAGPNYAITAVVCSLPIAVAGGIVIKKKLGFYYSALAGCAAMLAALGLLVLCISFLWQNSMNGLLLEYVERVLNANPEITRIYYFTMSAVQGGATIDMATVNLTQILAVPLDTAVKGLMRIAEQNLLLYLPQLCASCVALFGLLNYIIPRAVIKKLGVGVGAVPVFSMWSLPNRFGTWSFALLVLSYVGLIMGWNNFELVYSIVMGFLSVIYSIQGMAFIDWALKKKINARAGRVAIIAVSYLLLIIVLNLYMWIGFFEQIAKIRKRAVE